MHASIQNRLGQMFPNSLVLCHEGGEFPVFSIEIPMCIPTKTAILSVFMPEHVAISSIMIHQNKTMMLLTCVVNSEYFMKTYGNPEIISMIKENLS